MKNISIKKMVTSGIMIALVFLVTKLAGFTAPFGYFNLGDAVVIVAGILLGKKVGFVSGAFGSALSDALTPGYLAFAPITFVVKGLEGFIVGAITGGDKGKSPLKKVVAVVAGSCIMIAGYFAAEAFILGAIDKTYGLAYAVNELVSTNLLQGALCSVIGYILSAVLAKANIRKYIN